MIDEVIKQVGNNRNNGAKSTVGHTRTLFAWTRARNFSFPGWRLVVTPLPHRTSFLRVRSMLAYSRASSSELPPLLALLSTVSGVAAAAAGGLCDDGDDLTSSGALIASGGGGDLWVVSISTGTLPGGAGGDSWTAGGRRGIGDGMSRDGGASGTSPLVQFGGIIACDI